MAFSLLLLRARSSWCTRQEVAKCASYSAECHRILEDTVQGFG